MSPSNHITIYGIKNCDTIKKTCRWFEVQGVSYQFHDYRKQDVDKDKIRSWLDKQDQSVLINRRGTTWRKLSDNDKQANTTEQYIALMQQNPALIKRPIVEYNDEIIVGYSEEKYQQEILKNSSAQ